MTDITRRILLDCPLPAPKLVERVEVREITLPGQVEVGAHRHPCPVFGQVVRGEILFQVEGQPPQRLRAGDLFYEPALIPILHFDAVDEPATFIAYFLLGPGEDNVLEMIG
jgi:quercetin dioxygenase-like cupin family protein